MISDETTLVFVFAFTSGSPERDGQATGRQ